MQAILGPAILQGILGLPRYFRPFETLQPGGVSRGLFTVLVLPALRDRPCSAGTNRLSFWCLASEILAEGSPIPFCGGSIQEEPARGD